MLLIYLTLSSTIIFIVLFHKNTGQGIALFAVHGSIGPGLSVKCRMRGPCHVNAVTVNNAVMKPIMPSKEVSFLLNAC